MFQELILDETDSSGNEEIPRTPREELTAEGSNDSDSMPELEDEIVLDTLGIPPWLIPTGVVVTFRGGRVTFEREQGPLWQEEQDRVNQSN